MSQRKLFRVDVRASNWGNQEGGNDPIIRIHGGKLAIAVDYSEIPKLIAELATLLHEQHRKDTDDR